MMILGPNKIHRPFGNVPGNKTSRKKIRQMKAEYLQGDARGTIAIRHGVSWSTVKRHTYGLKTPGVPAALSNIEITGLLAGWRA